MTVTVDVAGWRTWARVASEGTEDDAVAAFVFDAAAALTVELEEAAGAETIPPAVHAVAVYVVTSDLWKRRDTLFANQAGGLEAVPSFTLPLDVRRQVWSLVGPWCRGPFA